MARKLGNKQYSLEFRNEVVSFLIEYNSYPLTKKKYGVSYFSLRKWIREDKRKEAQRMARKQGNKNYAPEFKTAVVIDSYESGKTLNEIVDDYNINISSLIRWRSQFKEDLNLLNSKRGQHTNHDCNYDIYDFNLDKMTKYEANTLSCIINNRTKEWTNIEKYQYIKLLGHSLMFLCKSIGIHRQSYYAWLKKENPYNAYDSNLVAKVQEIHLNKPEMGYRTITDSINQDWLNKEENSIKASDYKVRRIMRYLGITGAYNSKRKPNSERRIFNYDDKDLIRRQFRAKEKYTKWYMDFTYMKIKKQMYYVLFIVDGYDKEIVHLKMYKRKTGRVVANALKNLIKDRNIDGSKLIIHTDQGNEFTNQTLRKLCVSHNIRQSFSRAGTPLDNALIESIISNYKRTFRTRYLKEKISKVYVGRMNTKWNLEYNTEIPQRILGSVPPLFFNL